MKIAIDGPAGSGKSTVAKLVASQLKYTYIDTGAMYRALTLEALKDNIPLNDSAALCKLALAVDISFNSIHGSNQQHVFCNGIDVTQEIRSPNVTASVAVLAQDVGVREIMVEKQRQLASKGNVVMDGRDIGEIVLPDADFKFFITASLTERARRRMLEWQGEGFKPELKEVMKVIRKRDTIDAERSVGALKILPDSLVVDTTDMSIEEVVDKIIYTVKGR